MAKEIMNAVIKMVSIDTERGLTAWLHLDLGGCGQGFGGYALYWPDREDMLKGNYAGVFIHRCIEIGGVEKWEQLPGKTIRVIKDSWAGPIEAIGHIIKDDWFYPDKEADRVRAYVQKGCA